MSPSSQLLAFDWIGVWYSFGGTRRSKWKIILQAAVTEVGVCEGSGLGHGLDSSSFWKAVVEEARLEVSSKRKWQPGVGRMAKVRQTTPCLANCPILGSHSLVSGLRALSQPVPRVWSWSSSTGTSGENQMRAGKRWRLSLHGVEDHWPLPLASTILRSMLNPWRHRDGGIGLANTGPSPDCSTRFYTSGVSAGGEETDQML